MKILRLCFLAILVALLASCATTQNFATAVQSWNGAKQDMLYRVWGYPVKTRKLNNGHSLLMYRRDIRGTTPTTVTPATRTVTRDGWGNKQITETPAIVTGGEAYKIHCFTYFEVNTRGIIVNTSFRGQACTATKDFMLSLMNPNVAPPAK